MLLHYLQNYIIPLIKQKEILKGKIMCQHIIMSKSKRKRIKVVRRRMKEKKKQKNMKRLQLKKIILEILLNTNIIPYSPKKIKIKPMEEYSILNPLISSLSPSAKSKGARLHSQTQLIHQIPKRGNKKVKKLK